MLWFLSYANTNMRHRSRFLYCWIMNCFSRRWGAIIIFAFTFGTASGTVMAHFTFKIQWSNAGTFSLCHERWAVCYPPLHPLPHTSFSIAPSSFVSLSGPHLSSVCFLVLGRIYGLMLGFTFRSCVVSYWPQTLKEMDAESSFGNIPAEPFELHLDWM